MATSIQTGTATSPSQDPDGALLALLRLLGKRGYRFVTPTPATHARVVARPDRQEARNLADVLGWSLPFEPALLDTELSDMLVAADALQPWSNGRLKSRYRVSSLGGALFLHSAYPTDADDAVFFGPDSYRFADLITTELADCPYPAGTNLVDMGAGAGVGAITAARLCLDLGVTMTDINPDALRLARINARAAGVQARTVTTTDLGGVSGFLDIALANPPYIIDSAGRDYRDGGGMHGAKVALEMAAAALGRLSPGGRLILYTGSAIVNGGDLLQTALSEIAADHGCSMRYREIDPDVFGEELENPPYRDVDRIAVVAAILTRGR
ncbi:class I SAM-dependent methyltransferase [Rhizorhabdus argentea]|uniref:class I SAM-dependent methyltransferase n=1 Tax=Rhizorhabdus argentea TaxID=1387174 RepID=UPI0030EBC0E2